MPKRQTSIAQTGFEPAIPASEWPQTQALDREATGNSQLEISCLEDVFLLISVCFLIWHTYAYILCTLQLLSGSGVA